MTTKDSKNIPFIDVNHLQRNSIKYKETVQKIKVASVNPGFFYLDNLPENKKKLLNTAKSHMDNLFSLEDTDPIKQEINTTGSKNSYGWMPMFQEPAYKAGTLAHVESFDFGRKSKENESPNHNNNRWPKIVNFKKDIRSTWDEYTNLGMLSLNAINDGLGLPRKFLTKNCASQDLSTMRLLNYPLVDVSLINKDNVGISAHTDFECMTLISQTAPGLEVMSSDNQWYKASADDKQILVIFGKMMEVWTNGHIKATKHRVQNREWQRYSIVMFFGANDNLIIEPLDQFIKDGNKRYPPIKQREHIDNEIKRAVENRDNLVN